MIVAQISDTHIALDTADAKRRLREFASTIADINSLDPAPDVIVHACDIVHNGRVDEYAQAAALLAKARAPVYVLPGNKDERVNLRDTFSTHRYFTPGHPFIDYAIEDHPVRLIALDTLSEGHGRGDFRREQVEHLIALIDAEPDKPIAVFAHHPPFEVTVGPDRFHFEDMAAMERLCGALQRVPQVVGLFCGHVHRPTTGRVGHIPAAVATSIATTLRKGDYPAEMTDRPTYLLHRFQADGRFTTETMIA